MKKDCPKYAKWFIKKGKLLNLVCFEVKLALIPNHTWWIDIGATTHISVTIRAEYQLMLKDSSIWEITTKLPLRRLVYLDCN